MTITGSARLVAALAALLIAHLCQTSFAQNEQDQRISPRDIIRITAYQNADLRIDSRVADDGTINYPLAGTVAVGGLTIAAAKQKLVQMMKQSGVDIEARHLSVELVTAAAYAAQGNRANDRGDYRLGPGDAIRVAVFQNPDLALETRISDSGTITYPLLGVVELGGLSLVGAEQKLVRLLKEGGFVIDPQLSINLVQVRGSQVSLLGLISKPGRYPLDQARMKLTDVLALGGGIVQGAADNVVLVGIRNGKQMRRSIDLTSMILTGSPEEDLAIQNGDILYVNKAPVFYILGEVQRPGSYRIERDMTLIQALATGGGITQRGTMRGIRVLRRDGNTGKGERVELGMQDPIRPDDVITVRESWF